MLQLQREKKLTPPALFPVYYFEQRETGKKVPPTLGKSSYTQTEDYAYGWVRSSNC
ncbi:hypothetical protein KKC1_19290 [Calderihabitans maritimus]|uniref:Uncharacterized protein n=1 Tax=Calderihabitans maritimus TaxID=1246530 RepID=A0A1Z5HU26_9FIRM|nr:hypothetical protein KKC1_19290 [Calderihabitans maritimus]